MTENSIDGMLSMVTQRKGTKNIMRVACLALCMLASIFCFGRYANYILPDIATYAPAVNSTAFKPTSTIGERPSLEVGGLRVECNATGPRREPTWKWYKHIDRSNTTEAVSNMTGPPSTTRHKRRRRLLIGQYSGYGQYTRLLNTTAPINLAYAKHHHCDLLILLGATQIVEKDGPCEPVARRASYDKVGLLRMALSKRPAYDQLLIVDADALMYDLDFDVTKLLYNEEIDDDDLLAAKGVHFSRDGLRTWDINNGVTLWNLNHPLIDEVVDRWESVMNRGLSNGSKMHGDQHYLHRILVNSSAVAHIRSLRKEFDYEKGTVVKHFVRKEKKDWIHTGIERREELIKEAIVDICEKHESFCGNLSSVDFVA